MDGLLSILCAADYAPETQSARAHLVDDECLIRVVLAEQLRDAGFVVTESQDGKTALALLRSGETFDALIADVQAGPRRGGTHSRGASDTNRASSNSAYGVRWGD